MLRGDSSLGLNKSLTGAQPAWLSCIQQLEIYPHAPRLDLENHPVPKLRFWCYPSEVRIFSGNFTKLHLLAERFVNLEQLRTMHVA